MIQKMFSIRDTKSETFHPPFFKPTHGEAERDMNTAVNESKSVINQYPEDFDLYYLGEFDTNTGKFNAKDSPEHLFKLINLKRTQKPAETNI